MRKQYYTKIEIRKYTNNKYYDVCYYFFVNPYLLKGVILSSHKIVISLEKSMWKCASSKNQESPQQKNCKLILSETAK